MEANVYNQSGEKTGAVTLPESVFGARWNADLVHQVVMAMQDNARQPVAHAKDRSEVRGGGRKPWKQKGTGRARHGSRRSPIWVGGGVTHGPSKERVFKKKINVKARAKALASVLSHKHKDGEILFLDTLTFAQPKTRDAKALVGTLSGIEGFDGLSEKKKNALLVVTPTPSAELKRSFSNFGNIRVEETRNLNPLLLLTYRYVAIVEPEESVKVLTERIQ